MQERKHIWPWIVVLLCVGVGFFWVSTDYWNYTMVAKSTVPIMDYWQWIYVYGQRALDGTLTFIDFFNSDLGEHIQPVLMAMNIMVLKFSHFDVKPLVEWGTILRIAIAACVVSLFVWKHRKTDNRQYFMLVLSAVAISMSIINYNQWEMTMEPFSLTNAYRVANYFLSFYLADMFIAGLQKNTSRMNLFHGALLGCYCAFLTIFVGAAYFVGHLVAIGLMMLWTLIQNRSNWKMYFWPMAFWGIISFVSACIYYALVLQRGGSHNEIQNNLNIIVLLIQGICFFWGGLFVHEQTMNQYGGTLTVIVGSIVLIYSIAIFIKYLKNYHKDKSLFPAMCFLYALVISFAISAGRVKLFGASSLAASRYVIETGIGFVGVIWMTFSVGAEENQQKFAGIKYVLCTLAAIVVLTSAANVEQNVAPYRKVYNENLKEMMMHLDDYSDDELGVFQANSPEYVRYCVQFFQENELSIFRGNE